MHRPWIRCVIIRRLANLKLARCPGIDFLFSLSCPRGYKSLYSRFYPHELFRFAAPVLQGFEGCTCTHQRVTK